MMLIRQQYLLLHIIDTLFAKRLPQDSILEENVPGGIQTQKSFIGGC